ncbi:MAG: hypothetical protein ACOYBY_16935, partial [Dermatophilaceae bacterium]
MAIPQPIPIGTPTAKMHWANAHVFDAVTPHAFALVPLLVVVVAGVFVVAAAWAAPSETKRVSSGVTEAVAVAFDGAAGAAVADVAPPTMKSVTVTCFSVNVALGPVDQTTSGL